MAQYTVRAGDTLWSIAERCYGHGYLWQQLAEMNPLARAGVLFEGQGLDLPPLSPLPSLADSRRLAQQLAHLPVRIKLDGSGPLFRFDGFGAFAAMGLVGELTFHRHGALQLADLSPNRLLGYRLEQLAWASDLFHRQFCQEWSALNEFEPTSTGPSVPRLPCRRTGLGYTITGNVGQWRVVNLQPNQAKRRDEWRCTVALKPAELFHGATLALDDECESADATQDRLMPFSRVLRAACPQLISPAALWVLTRDRSCFPQGQVAAYEPLLPMSGNGMPLSDSTIAIDSEPAAKKKRPRFLERKPPKRKSVGRMVPKKTE
jgi:hypothetical protein